MELHPGSDCRQHNESNQGDMPCPLLGVSKGKRREFLQQSTQKLKHKTSTGDNGEGLVHMKRQISKHVTEIC